MGEELAAEGIGTAPMIPAANEPRLYVAAPAGAPAPQPGRNPECHLAGSGAGSDR
jgi:hypothetical protein